MAPTWKLLRDDGTIAESEKERWCWEAYYTDGTILKQFDDNGNYHQFREIDQSKLFVFGMVHEHLPPIILTWREGLKLIHFYKNFHLEAFTPREVKFKFYCFGYEGIGANNNVIKVVFAIMPNDGVVVCDDVDKLAQFVQGQADNIRGGA